MEFEEICEDQRWEAPKEQKSMDHQSSFHTDINGSFAFASTKGNAHESKPFMLNIGDSKVMETEEDDGQDKEEFAKE